VIALALSSIALQHGIPSAFAQSGQPVKVIICDPIRYLVDCADVTYGGVKIQR
jgi:hypothetical protein